MRTVVCCVGFCLTLLLQGCATAPGPRVILGAPVDPPPGWIDYCQRNPSDVSCKNQK